MVALKISAAKDSKNLPKDRLKQEKSIMMPNAKAICNRMLFYNVIACLGVAILGFIWIFIFLKARWQRDDEGNLVMTFHVIFWTIVAIILWFLMWIAAVLGFLDCIQGLKKKEEERRKKEELKKKEAAKAVEGDKILTV